MNQRIDDMSNDITKQLRDDATKSKVFALQLDVSIGIKEKT